MYICNIEIEERCSHFCKINIILMTNYILCFIRTRDESVLFPETKNDGDNGAKLMILVLHYSKFLA
tara:strand:- start:287 stop:484 length:198 start_codon:yes stop_codon:yes gene_type:complete